MTLTPVQLGFTVGAIPTVCMILASYILSQMEENEKLNAFLSNFAGGIIIAAVAAELFPLVMSAPEKASMIGCTIGFAVGMILVLFMDTFIEFVVENLEELNSKNLASDHKKIESNYGEATEEDVTKISITYPEGYKFEEQDIESVKPDECTSIKSFVDSSDCEGSPGSSERKRVIVVEKNVKEGDEFDEEGLTISVKALKEVGHKSHIQEHMNEICDMIRLMDSDCKRILGLDSTSASAQRVAEEIAEGIDEKIHLLQYKVDHSRRLLQGNESKEGGGIVRSWLTEDKKKAMSLRLSNLNKITDHIIEHIKEDAIDKELIKELYEHMEEMESQIDKFHLSVCEIGNRWVRKGRGVKSLPVTKEGDTVPVNLVIPVVIDCFVDGFLIGISLSLAPKAGFVLCAANCLEMSILGMAYSGAVSNCTQSSDVTRLLALYVPPLIMWLASGLGAAVGTASYKNPAVFVGFVSFGIVNLVFLSCVELIPEAKEINEKDENQKWYILAPVFFGIWVSNQFHYSAL